MGDMFREINSKFNAVRRPLLERCKVWAGAAIEKKMKELEKEEAKGAVPKKAKGSEGQPIPKQFIAGGGDHFDESESAKIVDEKDVQWAIVLMAPWGFSTTEGDPKPILRSPQVVVMPLLAGLKDLEKQKNFRELLRTTNLGKAVNSLRLHPPSAEVKKVAKG